MEFFTSDRSTFSRQARLGGNNKNKGDDGLFVWISVIVILIALNIFSWAFCLWVFGRPEHPFCYDLQMSVEKLAPLKDYSPQTAPRGKFYDAKQAYTDFFNLSDSTLASESLRFQRKFVSNHDATDKSATYMSGTYIVYNVHVLEKSSDVFPSGIVVRGRAENFPNVVLELILPSVEELPETHYDLDINSRLQVNAADSALILNIARIPEDRDSLIITAVPVVYGSHKTPAATTIALSPPERLNLYNPFPITKEMRQGPPNAAPPAEPEPASAEEAAQPAETAMRIRPGVVAALPE